MILQNVYEVAYNAMIYVSPFAGVIPMYFWLLFAAMCIYGLKHISYLIEYNPVMAVNFFDKWQLGLWYFW